MATVPHTAHVITGRPASGIVAVESEIAHEVSPLSWAVASTRSTRRVAQPCSRSGRSGRPSPNATKGVQEQGAGYDALQPGNEKRRSTVARPPRHQPGLPDVPESMNDYINGDVTQPAGRGLGTTGPSAPTAELPQASRTAWGPEIAARDKDG